MSARKRILMMGDGKSVFITRLLETIEQESQSQISIDFYDRSCYTAIASPIKGALHTYSTQVPTLYRPLLRIPKLRLIFRIICEWKTVSSLLKKNHYDILNIHQLPFYSLLFVRSASRHHVKTMLTPIGSDALRLSKKLTFLLKGALNEADHVSMNMQTGFAQKVINRYDIDKSKIHDLSYGSEAISAICQMKGHYDRQTLADMLGIPYASYYICCGYNAHRAQQHAMMLKALAANVSYLPDNYKILVPLGYGDKDNLKKELRQLSNELNLDVVFLMDFLSPEKVAALRLITDLFIHIQTTDAHCFTMHEFILADTQIINGAWLNYPELEEYGMPYYTIKSPKYLKETVRKVLNKKLPPIYPAEPLKKKLSNSTWPEIAKRWINFYLLEL